MESKTGLGVGVDFGTSNSVVATYDGSRVQVLNLEAGSPVLPSAVYLDRQRKTLTGRRAVTQFVADNRGRRVELVPEVVGRAELLVADDPDELSRAAPETVTMDTVSDAMVDIGLPSRLFRGVKRLLGDAATDRLLVFEEPFRLVALVTPLLLHLRQAVSSNAGVLCCVGRPVNFEGRGVDTNAVALGRLREACDYAGFAVAADLPEPVAATHAYLASVERRPNTVLTFDFGGGTLDLCLIRSGEDRHRVLATHGIALGGDHIDQLLFETLLYPLLGKGEIWRRRGVDRMIETRFPFERYERLLVNWSMSYLLNQGRFRGPVADQIAQGGSVAQKFQRLEDVIVYNLSFEIFQALKNLKEALSTRPTVALDLPQIDVELELTREAFDGLIAPALERVEMAVESVMKDAGLDADSVDVVLCTGGSSLIPAVQKILAHRFEGRVETYDPFTSVASGLAIADYRSRVGNSL